MKFILEEMKNQVVAEYEAGATVPQLSKKYSFEKSAIYRWINERDVRDVNSVTKLSQREFHHMQRELERLRLDNLIYHKCGCSRYADVAQRLETIEQLKDQYNIHALCRVLDIKRPTFYNYSKRKKPQTVYQKVDTELMPIIQKFFEQSQERFGAGKIKVKLDESGYKISAAHISRLMKEMGLICKQQRLRCFNTTNRKYMFRQNRVMQNFTQTAPNAVWVSDVTYARINNDFYAICVALDLFSRKVLAYTISPNNDTPLIIETFQKAFKMRGKPQGLTFHSDQGTQYAAYAFGMLLHENGIVQSFSNPGVPYDNAVAESFFSIMKREELSHNYYHSLEELNSTVSDFIEFFNEMRPHMKLGNVSPNEFERQYDLQLDCENLSAEEE